MTSFLKRLWKEEDGPTAVEYGLMVALIAVVIIVAVEFLGTTLSDKFSLVGQKVADAGATT